MNPTYSLKEIIDKPACFYSSCRLCLKSNRELFLLYENSSVPEKIAICLGIQVSRHDKLPQNVCMYCLKLLNTLYDVRDQLAYVDGTLYNVLQIFWKQCREVDAVLQSCLTEYIHEEKGNDKYEQDDATKMREDKNYAKSNRKVKIEMDKSIQQHCAFMGSIEENGEEDKKIENNIRTELVETGNVIQSFTPSCEKEECFDKSNCETYCNKEIKIETVLIKEEAVEENFEMSMDYEDHIDPFKTESDTEYDPCMSKCLKVEIVEGEIGSRQIGKTSDQISDHEKELHTTVKHVEKRSGEKGIDKNLSALNFNFKGSQEQFQSVSAKRHIWKKCYAYLEQFYKAEPYPRAAVYKELESRLGITEKNLRSWFSRRRFYDQTGTFSQNRDIKNKRYACFEEIYKVTPSPSNEVYQELQGRFGLSDKYLRNWFSRRRLKDNPADSRIKTNLDPQSKKKNTKTNKLEHLENIYRSNCLLDNALYEELQRQLGVSQKYLRNWFSKRRIKDKNETSDDGKVEYNDVICKQEPQEGQDSASLMATKIDECVLSDLEKQSEYSNTLITEPLDVGKVKFGNNNVICKKEPEDSSLFISAQIDGCILSEPEKQPECPNTIMTDKCVSGAVTALGESHNNSSRKYTTISSDIRIFLEQYFQKNQRPSSEEYTELEEKLALPRYYINRWFRRQRRKGYKMNKAVMNSGRTRNNYMGKTSDTYMYLKEFFQKVPLPSSQEYSELQAKLGLSKHFLHCWFSRERGLTCSKMVPKMYSCFECKEQFGSLNTLRNHINSHLSEMNYSCDICGKKFLSQLFLTRHTLCYTHKERYKCDVCGKGFMYRSGIYNHVQSHK